MPPDTPAVYDRAGLDTLVGYGDSPALIVVDLQRGFTDPSCVLGGDLSSVVERTNELLDPAHETDCPVVATRIVTSHPDGADLGIWGEKIPTLELLAADSEWVDLDERLDLRETDHVLEKRQASSFHETELHSMLTAWGVDTLVVAGCTTSGCIRATAVDGCSHGFRVIVPEESVGDRAPEPHEANLFDIHAKYGDVRPFEEVVDYLRDPSALRPHRRD
ncbi:isochorismatase family protein [Natronorubrum tibetense]|uniref:Isochorismatase n=1 Tax=Natronorubrum tibetense GA33 TaxID=1114856 RepID=L9VPN9_9EURY|nr:isochorismatase family protein [Natronorubrum tibetense]ELY38996.1 isochorismatase [Natronorubrum tibetense GA33]